MQSSCSVGLASFCPTLLRQPERFCGLLGTTSIQGYDTLQTQLPTQLVAHKPIDSGKDAFAYLYSIMVYPNRVDASLLYNPFMVYRVPAVLPKTEFQRVKELKKMLVESKGEAVVKKVIDIALDDDHPMQMAALKMCMERALPVSLFEKTSAQRNAVNITISGIGVEVSENKTIEADDIEDVEPK